MVVCRDDRIDVAQQWRFGRILVHRERLLECPERQEYGRILQSIDAVSRRVGKKQISQS